MNKFLSKTLKWVTANKPEALMGLGLGLFGFTIVETVVATNRATKKIEKKKVEDGVEKLEAKEVIRLVWKDYILTLIGAVGSVGSIAASGKVYSDRISGAVALAALGESKAGTLLEKLEDTVGEEKTEEIKNEIADKEIKNINYSPELLEKITDDTYICIDELSNQAFVCNEEKIRWAVNQINHRFILGEGYIYLNELYALISEDLPNGFGGYQGWGYGTKLEFPKFSHRRDEYNRDICYVWSNVWFPKDLDGYKVCENL